MSDFRTRIDYSSNRQVKQFQQTETALSGTTTFGLPYSGLTSGVDDGTIATTSTLINITSTFTTISGESTTYIFGDPRMDVGIAGLGVITDANSGTTQTGYGFEGDEFIELDGNVVYQTYTGSTYDLYVTSVEEISPDILTGTCESDLVVMMSGDSIDYQERTIWVDVKGITKTEQLIIEREPKTISAAITGTTTVLTRDDDGNVAQIEVGNVVGDKTFNYNQGLPSATWIITHGMNKYPSVIVINSTGDMVEGHIEYVDKNNVILTFSGAFSGDAIFN